MPPGKKKSKKPRGSRGVSTSAASSSVFPSHHHHNNNNNKSKESYFDLMVLLPKKGFDRIIEMQLHIRKIMERLETIGYTHMALTHTIYGRPRPEEDKAENAIPKSLWTSNSSNTISSQKGGRGQEPKKKRQRTESTASVTTAYAKTNRINSNNSNPKIRVLRRLHVIVENLSDVSIFLSNSPCKDLLNEYDIVSVSPRNEPTFQSVCSSAGCIDIITLDYHQTRGLKLPYKIRPSDIQQTLQSRIAFEIQYSPALLHQKQRKALIHTCRELQMAAYNTTGTKKNLQVLFSSGDRTFEDADVGSMALRLPGDLINLMQVVLQFDSKTSINSIKKTGNSIVKKAEERRFGKGKSDVVDVQIETTESLLMKSKTVKLGNTGSDTPLSEPTKHDNIPQDAKPKEDGSDTGNAEEDDDDDDNDDGDGFIAM